MKVKFVVKFLVIAATAFPEVVTAQAQVDSRSDGSDNTIEEISVTGTRIKRDSFSSPMPMVGLSKDDIETAGSPSLTDILLEVPSMASGLNQSNTTASLQNAGVSSIKLRSLGDNRTLVLIDGRRTVSNSANGNRVSLGTIPSGFVERVEVITGGASTVYGSDAVAGVVNIITEQDQQGLEIDGRFGRSGATEFEDTNLDISFGSLFNAGSGYFHMAASYDDQSGIRAVDKREKALVQASWDYVDGVNMFETFTGDQPARDITRDQYADLSSDPDGGRFDGNNFWYDNNGLRRDFLTNRDGFDFRRDDHILVPRERLNLALKMTYRFLPHMEGFAQLIYSKIDTDNLREPEGDDYNDRHTLFNFADGSSELIEAGRIPIDNPFAPEIIKMNEPPAGIRWDRRFVEVGLQRTVNERETTRFWGGVKGEVFAGWEWEASLGYGKYDQEQTRFNEINILNLTQGLNAEAVPGGEIRCVDASARAKGCVPVNLFGRGSITPEAAAYIRANLGLTSEVEQLNVLAYMTGTLFELPAGDLDIAFGIEYRDDETSLDPDELNRTGGHSSNFVPAFSGQSDVKEIFFEATVPLLSGVPGVKMLTWDMSGRFADYSQKNVGSVTSYGAGLQWRPIDDLNIRLSQNRALRAPDLTELFSPPRGDSDSFNDICKGVTLSSVGVVDDNCRSESGVLANIIANGAFVDENRSKFSPNSGNRELFEETADTFTFGLVWEPAFLPDFSLASDYYRIEIEDAIDAFSNDEILRQCYEDSATFGSENFFCNEITRNQGDGQIVGLIQRELNLDEIEASGVDTTLRYQFELDAIGVPGNFDLRYIHTHVIKHKVTGQSIGGGVVVDNKKGELESDNFEDRSLLTFGWRYNDFRITWRAKYFSAVNSSNDLKEDFAKALASNPNAEKPFFLGIGSEMFHDVYMSYNIKMGDIDYKVYAGVKNVFDNDDPFLPSGAQGGGDNHNDVYGNIRGRFPYLGVNIRL